MAKGDSWEWPPCGITVSPMGRIKGWMIWPEDPIYRPVVGLFVNGSLRAAVPTFRNRQVIDGDSTVVPEDIRKTGTSSALRSSWICEFDFGANHVCGKVGLTDKSVVCLETGQVLYPKPSPQCPDSDHEIFGIDEVIARALFAQKPPDVSGFSHFLSLLARDQLAVLFLSVLGRPIDSEAAEHFELELTSKNTTTILDIRDRVLTSPEFADREISLHERVGLWMVWGGLCDVLPSVLSMAPSLSLDRNESSALVVSQAESKWHMRFLAALALGPWVQQTLVRDLWISDHRRTRDLFHPWRSKVATAPVPSRVGICFPDLLSSMEIGPAGAPGENGVQALSGREGLVVYGPYLTLPPGQYRLTALLGNGTPAEEAATNDVRVETFYGRVLMGSRVLSSGDRNQTPGVLSFVVQQFSMGYLDDARFEFRVHSRGLKSFYIRSLSLEVIPRTKDDVELEWLPLMSVGGAGKIMSNNSAEIFSTLTAQGHVVYGPYAKMLPGKYSLIVECTILKCADPTTSVDLEVVIAPNENLSARTYELVLGAHALELEFMISQEIFQRQDGDVEFRVHKTMGAELIITGIKTMYYDTPMDDSDTLDNSSGAVGSTTIQGRAYLGTRCQGRLSRWFRRRGADQPQC